MKRIKIMALGLCFLFFISAFTVLGEAKTVELVVADDMPPAAMRNEVDGFHGYSVETFQAVCAKAGFQAKVTYQPWVRAQQTVSDGKNLVIMGLGRTPAREKDYLWVSPVSVSEWVFVSNNGKAYDMASGKSLSSVMIQSGTPVVDILLKAGYTNLSQAPVNLMNAKKLVAGRGDTWVTPILSAKWIWKREGLPGKPTFGPVIWKSEQWMAMSPGSDPTLANTLKKGVDDIKADGTYKKIMDRYDD